MSLPKMYQITRNCLRALTPCLLTRLKITKTVVDRADPAAGSDFFIWDLQLVGFGLRVKPSGAKSFVIQYRNAHGRSRRLTLGKYGEKFTADQARNKAKNI